MGSNMQYYNEFILNVISLIQELIYPKRWLFENPTNLTGIVLVL